MDGWVSGWVGDLGRFFVVVFIWYLCIGRSITMQKLLMIKWQTSAESIHYLRIMEVAATQWKTLGGLLKISPATLESYETQHMKKNEECIRSVFKKWIEATSEEVRQVSVLLLFFVLNI